MLSCAVPDSGCSSLPKIGNGCRDSREKHQKMRRSLENMERLKAMRLFSLGMRGLRGEITVLECVKGSCEGEGSKPFSVASGGMPRSAELKLQQGKQVLGKKLPNPCLPEEWSSGTDGLGWARSLHRWKFRRAGWPNRAFRRADPVLRQWNKFDKFSKSPFQCWFR